MPNYTPDKDRTPADPEYVVALNMLCKGIRMDLETILDLTTDFNYKQLQTAYDEAKDRYFDNSEYLDLVEELFLEIKTKYFDFRRKDREVRVSIVNPPMFWKEGDCMAITLPNVDDRIYSVRHNPQLTRDDNRYILKEYQPSGVYTYDTLYYYTEEELISNGATEYVP